MTRKKVGKDVCRKKQRVSKVVGNACKAGFANAEPYNWQNRERAQREGAGHHHRLVTKCEGFQIRWEDTGIGGSHVIPSTHSDGCDVEGGFESQKPARKLKQKRGGVQDGC